MQRGVIVRHLLLPGHKKNARDVIRYVFETYGDAVYLSLLNQYTPFERLREMPEYQSICRKVTRREYDAVVDYALELGVRNAFVQEGDTARERHKGILLTPYSAEAHKPLPLRTARVQGRL